MDNTSLLSKSTYSKSIDNTHEISIAAKLRRLKIEENILLQRLHNLDNNLNETKDHPFTEYRFFFTKTKNTFAEIKRTFQDVKTSVSSQEMLKSIEIDEIRGNIQELEKNIKSFKASLHTELTALKSTARQLNSDLCEVPVKIDKIMKSTKGEIAKYNEIVPSPVKILMNSPLKCVEVQEFQEFMKNSLNRYGGWNEYNHNIFVNSWQKICAKIFFSRVEDNSCWRECDIPIENSSTFQTFLEEILPKLQGLSPEDIISHAKWYLTYLNLKERQQKAIDKWRLNRLRMKKSTKVVQNLKKSYDINFSRKYDKLNNKGNNNICLTEIRKIGDKKRQIPSSCNFHRKCLSEESTSSFEESIESDEILHFLRPTKQWSNWCNNKSKGPQEYNNSLENIKKLGTPIWRTGL